MDDQFAEAPLGQSCGALPSETVSNGVHHGTFRHEQGNADLRSEHGYQLDIVDWVATRWEAHVATYFNYFDNFIT